MNTFETPYERWLRENAVQPIAADPSPRPWKITVARDGTRFVYEAENA